MSIQNNDSNKPRTNTPIPKPRQANPTDRNQVKSAQMKIPNPLTSSYPAANSPLSLRKLRHPVAVSLYMYIYLPVWSIIYNAQTTTTTNTLLKNRPLPKGQLADLQQTNRLHTMLYYHIVDAPKRCGARAGPLSPRISKRSLGKSLRKSDARLPNFINLEAIIFTISR